MDLADLVFLQEDYYPDLIRQFHCTVFFHDDDARTMTWMAGREQCTSNYAAFCEALGYGNGRASGFKIHSERTMAAGVLSFCYPKKRHYDPPSMSGMYFFYFTLARLFKENLVSKSGDHVMCHGYHANLMFYCHPERQRKIDGCDYIYMELRRSVRGA